MFWAIQPNVICVTKENNKKMFAFERVYVVSTTWPLVKLYASELCCEMLWAFWLKGWRSNWRARELLTLLWFPWGRTEQRLRLQGKGILRTAQSSAWADWACHTGLCACLHGSASPRAAPGTAALRHPRRLLPNSEMTDREKSVLGDAPTFCMSFEVCFARQYQLLAF